MTENTDGRGKLPPGWAWARLGEICSINPPTDVSHVPSDAAVTFVPMAAVEELTGKMDSSHRRPLREVTKGFVKFATGDVIFAKITPCMENGKIAIVPELPYGIGYGSTEFHVIRPQQGIYSAYVFYFVLQEWFRADARRHMTGAVGQQRVPVDYLRNAWVPVAPTAEQQRIVARIDELFGEIEAGEQELGKAREGLAAYRRAILKAAVTGELTREWREKNPPNETGADLLARILVERRAARESSSTKLTMNDEALGASARKKRYQEPEPLNTADLPKLPPGWTWANVDQLCWFMQYGSSAKCTSEPSGVPVLRMGNIQDGQIDYDNLKYLPEDHPEFPDLLLDAGDVLFNRTNSAELVGKTAVYDGRKKLCSFASYLIRLKLTGVMPEYFSYVLNSSYGREWIAKNKSQQVGQANVSGGKLKKLCVPVPPKAEQQEIVRKVEELLGAANDLETNNSIWVDSVRLRESILAAAFSGKLVPQDPADEPAAALLQRLKASPDRQQTPRSQRRSKAA